MHGGHRVPFMTTHANVDWQDKTRQVSITFFMVNTSRHDIDG